MCSIVLRSILIEKSTLSKLVSNRQMISFATLQRNELQLTEGDSFGIEKGLSGAFPV